MLTVRPLDRKDIHAAAGVAARAFRNKPAMVAILRRSEAERLVLLERFGQTLFSTYQRWGRSFVACEGDRVCAAMMTLPWENAPLPWTTELTLGLTSLRLGGLWTTGRFGRIDSFVKTRRPRHPHHYLYMLATDPEHQRRGFGSRLLQHLVGELSPRETYLETDEPDNLPFYRKNGFEVLGKETSPIGKPRFPIWFLSKQAVAPAK